MKHLAALPALLAFLLATGCYTGSRPPHMGSAAKEFTVQDSDRTVSLNQFRGQVVILNFWATWCPPCIEELPSLMTYAGTHARPGSRRARNQHRCR